LIAWTLRDSVEKWCITAIEIAASNMLDLKGRLSESATKVWESGFFYYAILIRFFDLSVPIVNMFSWLQPRYLPLPQPTSATKEPRGSYSRNCFTLGQGL
jgi:hypothetical protein